ncbi:MAG: 16S rRNA (cytosine(1402)-N(4))-methyltransferase RsmH [Elusimicrobiota bacterium]
MFPHVPVLLNEVMEALSMKPGGRYVDGTLGLGGYAEQIVSRLDETGEFLGIDTDSTYLEFVKDRLQPLGKKTRIRHVNFRRLQEILQELGWDSVDGMVFDLGLSSTQLAEASRGLSFMNDGPLDMRLNPSQSTTALSYLQSIDRHQLVTLLIEFGEGRFAKRLSEMILRGVSDNTIHTTFDLARICERVKGRHGKKHPATEVFLALRSEINAEQRVLKELLDKAPLWLKESGRLVVVSFHSLEDRIVKNSFRYWTKEYVGPEKYSLVYKKPLVPSLDEVKQNPRSRSAKLRTLMRVS